MLKAPRLIPVDRLSLVDGFDVNRIPTATITSHRPLHLVKAEMRCVTRVFTPERQTQSKITGAAIQRTQIMRSPTT